MAERVLVCGGRWWSDRDYLWRTLDSVHAEVGIECVIEGECCGADIMAREWAKSRDIPYDPFPANWNRYKKAAGPIRNAQMLNEGKPTLVLAFHGNIEASSGTKDMVERAKRAGVSWRIYPDYDRPLEDK